MSEPWNAIVCPLCMNTGLNVVHEPCSCPLGRQGVRYDHGIPARLIGSPSGANYASNYARFTNGSRATFDAVGVEQLLATMHQFQEEQRRIDAGLVKALRSVILRSGNSLYSWALMLNMPVHELDDTLNLLRPVSEQFRAEVRRVFAPLRPTPPSA